MRPRVPVIIRLFLLFFVIYSLPFLLNLDKWKGNGVGYFLFWVGAASFVTSIVLSAIVKFTSKGE